MVRIPLKKDDLVSKYIIDETIGDGASCVVYAAHYTDSSGFIHNVRLKECYPYGTEIKRNANAIVWQNKAEQTNALASFKIAYEKLLKMQNDNNVGNAHAHVFDLFEANNTLYSVMDVTNGVTFEIDNSDKLSDILKTILALTKVVEKYHASGYLHLDIKPGNFLVIPETRELVILFDVDSVTTIEDIKDGKIKCVPYSKNWAAPEQMQGQLGKLCPATDIYSIGAILFQKIMNRSVENSDMGIFANWNLDDIKMFENVNPAVKRLICDIFKHTLSANPKRRYQNTDKLISALEEAVETVRDGAPYIDSDCPAPNKNFIGREKEILDIEKSFKNGSNAVFIHGFGGIGKSELVKRYAQTHKKDYDAILFLSYENSLEELIEDINIVNCSDDKQHNKTLKKVLKQQKVLLIIDNFDVEIDEDDYLDNLLRFNADIIFTSRTDFSALAVDNTMQINIQALNKSELIDLFSKECGRVLDDAEKETVDEILKNYNYYTLLVPIFARQLTASGWSLEQLKETTDKGLKAFEETEKIVVLKDGKLHKKTGLDMMRATFRVFGLSEIQKQVLINLYFLRFVKMNKEQYRKYLWKQNESKVKHIDAINDLLELGWIQKKNAWDVSEDVDLTIHPIIVEMIVCELEPDITKSDMLMLYMQDYLPWKELGDELFEGADDWSVLHTDEISHKLNWFCLFAASIDLHNINNLTYVVDTMYTLINGNIYVIEIIYGYYFEKFLDKLQYALEQENNIDCKIMFKIANILETKWAEELRYFYSIGGNNTKEKELERQENIKKYFFKARDFVDKVEPSYKKDVIKLLCKPILQALVCCGGSIYKTNVPKSIYLAVAEYEDLLSEMFENFYDIDWEKEDGDFIDNFDDVYKKETPKTNEIVLDKEKDGECYYINKYKLGYDVDEIVSELISDARYSNHEKANIFDDIMDSIYGRTGKIFDYTNQSMCQKNDEFLKNTDWDRLLKISSHYLAFCLENDFAQEDDVEYEIQTANKCITVAKAMLGDDSLLKEAIEHLISQMLSWISDIDIDDATDWKNFTQFYDISDIGKDHMSFYMLTFGITARLLHNLRKNHLFLPCLIKCSNALEEKIRENIQSLQLIISQPHSQYFDAEYDLGYDVNASGDPMSLMYNWYRNIAEFALNSYFDPGVSRDERLKCFGIYTEYLKKMRSFTDKSYAFVNHTSRSNREVNFDRYYYQYETIADVCIDYYEMLYKSGISIEEFTTMIENDDRISPLDILRICSNIAREEFFEIHRCWTVKGGCSAMREHLRTNDWSRIEALLDFEEDVYFDTEDFDDENCAYSLNSECDKYRIVLYAITENKKSTDEYLQQMYNTFIKYLDKCKDDVFCPFHTDFDVLSGDLRHQGILGETFYWLEHIEKCHLALPYMIKLVEYLPAFFKIFPDYSEDLMYGWYKAIMHYAEEASNEVTMENGSTRYFDTYLEYEKRVNDMSNKDYEENY